MKSLRGTLVGLTLVAIATISPEAKAFKIVSFNGRFTRWESNQIHYKLDKRGSKDFNGDAFSGCDPYGPCKTVEEAIQKSFNAWAGVPGVNLEFVEDSSEVFNETGYDHKNSVVFIESNWRGQPFMPPSGALAVTLSTYRTDDSVIEDSDMHFNGEFFKWGVINSAQEEGASDVVDIQNIATHEAGHFIGLAHSSEDIFEPITKLYQATMFFASGPGEIFRRNLKEDDTLAIENLYPNGGVAAPIVETISPEVIDASAGKTVTVQILGRGFQNNATALIAVNSNNEDVVGNVVSVSDNEINVVFDVSKLSSGKYDVLVANAYQSDDRLPQALTISGGLPPGASGSSGPGQASTNSGGCALAPSDNSGASLLSGLIVFLLPLVLIGATRLVLASNPPRAKTKKPNR